MKAGIEVLLDILLVLFLIQYRLKWCKHQFPSPSGNQARATVTVTVMDKNDAPTAVDETATTLEAIPVATTVICDVDSKGNTLQLVRIAMQPAKKFMCMPNPDFYGKKYEIHDSSNDQARATFTVTVTDKNDTLSAINNKATTPVTITVLDNDLDSGNDELLVSFLIEPVNSTFLLVKVEREEVKF